MNVKNLRPVGTYQAGGKTVVRYRCECGKEFSFRSYESIPVMDCDTCRYSHSSEWNDNKRLYLVWNGMRQRCENKNTRAYKQYGARGISVCQEWKNFHGFLEWALSSGYKEGLSIERIDVNGDYCPENCKWIPLSEQAKNTRRNYVNKHLTINGVTKTYQEWADYAGIPALTISRRIGKGKSGTDLILPVKKEKGGNCRKFVTINGVRKSITEWCKDYGISRQAVSLRLKSGESLESAITRTKEPRKKRI